MADNPLEVTTPNCSSQPCAPTLGDVVRSGVDVMNNGVDVLQATANRIVQPVTGVARSTLQPIRDTQKILNAVRGDAEHLSPEVRKIAADLIKASPRGWSARNLRMWKIHLMTTFSKTIKNIRFATVFTNIMMGIHAVLSVILYLSIAYNPLLGSYNMVRWAGLATLLPYFVVMFTAYMYDINIHHTSIPGSHSNRFYCSLIITFCSVAFGLHLVSFIFSISPMIHCPIGTGCASNYVWFVIANVSFWIQGIIEFFVALSTFIILTYTSQGNATRLRHALQPMSEDENKPMDHKIESHYLEVAESIHNSGIPYAAYLDDPNLHIENTPSYVDESSKKNGQDNNTHDSGSTAVWSVFERKDDKKHV
jgi:ABC-type Fe3+-siderophore transport system permease subunit